jgi:hypothetical protein
MTSFSAVQDACCGVILEFLDDGAWSPAFSALSATSKKLDAAVRNFCHYRLRVLNTKPGNDWLLASIVSCNLSPKQGKALWERPRSLLIDVVADSRRPIWCIAPAAGSADFVFRRAPLCSFKRPHTHRHVFHRGQWFVIGDSQVEIFTPCPTSALGFRVHGGAALPVANLVSFALVSVGRDVVVLGGIDEKMVGSSLVFRLLAEGRGEEAGMGRWVVHPQMSPLPPWVSTSNQRAAFCPRRRRLYLLGGKATTSYLAHAQGGDGACQMSHGRCLVCGADESPQRSSRLHCSYFDLTLGRWVSCPPLDFITWSYAFPWKVFVRDGVLFAVAVDSSDVVVAQLDAGAGAWKVDLKIRGGDVHWRGVGAARWRQEGRVLFLDKVGSITVDVDTDPDQLPSLRRRPYSECTLAPLRSWHSGMGADEGSPFLARSATDASRDAADSGI